jgi:hypothetical protein
VSVAFKSRSAESYDTKKKVFCNHTIFSGFSSLERKWAAKPTRVGGHAQVGALSYAQLTEPLGGHMKTLGSTWAFRGLTEKLPHLAFGFQLSLVAMLLAGCASGPRHFQRSYDVADLFQDGRILADHQYYVSGDAYKPLAIVALLQGYTLDSPQWQAVQPDKAQLDQWILRMDNQPGAEYNTESNGARILDPQGRPVGMWYSVWALPGVTFKSGQALDIGRPMTVFPISNRNPEDRGPLMIWPR